MKMRELWEKIKHWNRDVEMSRTLKDAQKRLRARVESLRPLTPRQRSKALSQDKFFHALYDLRKEVDAFDAVWRKHFTMTYDEALKLSKGE